MSEAGAGASARMKVDEVNKLVRGEDNDALCRDSAVVTEGCRRCVGCVGCVGVVRQPVSETPSGALGVSLCTLFVRETWRCIQIECLCTKEKLPRRYYFDA